jgi:catechol 2,3-dioxygenase-like lactoylglutathione lyase family enzyme
MSIPHRVRTKQLRSSHTWAPEGARSPTRGCAPHRWPIATKPAPLAARGGCWFQEGPVQLHLGVEADFRPARKAHPALKVRGFDALCAALKAAGVSIRPDDELPGVRRCHIDDPFGNRIELIELTEE